MINIFLTTGKCLGVFKCLVPLTLGFEIAFTENRENADRKFSLVLNLKQIRKSLVG